MTSKKVGKIYKDLLLRICLIGIIILIINIFFYQLCIVDGVSMEPTLTNGKIVFIKKYNLDLKHNDIVVVRKNGKIIIKRLVGLPKDKLKIDEYLYVNGIKNDELYTKDSGQLQEEMELKENEYFVLGDNRQNSIDSRFSEIGIIYENEIIGKIME